MEFGQRIKFFDDSRNHHLLFFNFTSGDFFFVNDRGFKKCRTLPKYLFIKSTDVFKKLKYKKNTEF